MKLVVRDDLSGRTALSKSTLTAFDLCPTQAWHDLHHRLPLIPSERITFGSAVDAAVEAAITYLRMEQPVDLAVVMAAAAEPIARDGTAVDLLDVEAALDRWMVTVAPGYDFRYARLQERISGEHPDLGPVDGHPDVVLADGRIFDVKTSARAKPEEPTLELGFYALIGREMAGIAAPSVGYWTYVRTTRPYWQTLEFPVTPELLRWTVAKAAAYVRARRADEMWNAGAEVPENAAMTAGPRWSGMCADCQYAPVCELAVRGSSDDAA